MVFSKVGIFGYRWETRLVPNRDQLPTLSVNDEFLGCQPMLIDESQSHLMLGEELVNSLAGNVKSSIANPFLFQFSSIFSNLLRVGNTSRVELMPTANTMGRLT